MSFRTAPLALVLAALPAALAAEPWEKVDELPGGIAVELDLDSVFEALDGARLVLRATFRRDLAMGMMESNVEIDCGLETAKLRGIRLMNGATVLSERIDHLADFAPINPGSAEAIYFRVLCGKPASVEAMIPEALPEDDGADWPPVEEPTAEQQLAGENGEAAVEEDPPE
jgi:hypothetical protein